MSEEAEFRAIVRRAAEIVAQGWTRGYAARDAEGIRTSYLDPEARLFCLEGAFSRAVYERLPEEHAHPEREALWRRFKIRWHHRFGGDSPPFVWNDALKRTQAEVVERLLDLGETK